MTTETARALVLSLLVPWLGGSIEPVQAQGYPNLAPYSAIRWNASETPEARIGGTWQILLSIDDLSIGEIVAFAQQRYGGLWQKRIDEDLVQVLSEIGHPPGETVRLTVRDTETGAETLLDPVPLTAENRRAVMRFKYPERYVGRPAAEVAPEAPGTPKALLDALASFQTALDERWSYRHANGADFDGAIAALRQRVTGGISLDAFHLELRKIIALGVDGHASLSGARPSGALLPFLVEPVGERFVAFTPERTGFLADGFPYLTKIDGHTVTAWCKAANRLVAKGSPQFRTRHCLRHLRHLELLRSEMGLPNPATTEVELTAEDATTRTTLTLPVAGDFPIYGRWPRRRASGRLEDNIGYLRLEQMDDEAVAEIHAWMPKLRDTDALIVDVRDNGGGSREALRVLDAYLAAPNTAPRVINAAVYRLHPEHGPDHLEARFMYRGDDARWTPQERKAIAEFARAFRPEWRPPESQFSDWHYMVLGGSETTAGFHYGKPVAVLTNAKCFSATDIFLAGLREMPNVTLVGTPSGGGSARSRNVSLPGLPWRLRLGSMASFQADGRLFDGHGVAPDVVVEPVPEYFIGGEDKVLAEATRIVRTQAAAQRP